MITHTVTLHLKEGGTKKYDNVVEYTDQEGNLNFTLSSGQVVKFESHEYSSRQIVENKSAPANEGMSSMNS